MKPPNKVPTLFVVLTLSVYTYLLIGQGAPVVANDTNNVPIQSMGCNKAYARAIRTDPQREGTIKILIDNELVATKYIPLSAIISSRVYTGLANTRERKVGDFSFTLQKVSSTTYCIGTDVSETGKTVKYSRASSLIYPQFTSPRLRMLNSTLKNYYLSISKNLFAITNGEVVTKAVYQQSGFPNKFTYPGNIVEVKDIVLVEVNRTPKLISFYNDETKYYGLQREYKQGCNDSIYLGALHYNMIQQKFIGTRNVLKKEFEQQVADVVLTYINKNNNLDDDQRDELQMKLRNPRMIKFMSDKLLIDYCLTTINDSIDNNISAEISLNLATQNML